MHTFSKENLGGIKNGIQQYLISISVFAHYNDPILFGSREDKKCPPSLRESYFLCMGGTGIRFTDAFFYHFRLSARQGHWKDEK